jgi:poly(3-hydroxybutyrate) depolymerase
VQNMKVNVGPVAVAVATAAIAWLAACSNSEPGRNASSGAGGSAGASAAGGAGGAGVGGSSSGSGGMSAGSGGEASGGVDGGPGGGGGGAGSGAAGTTPMTDAGGGSDSAPVDGQAAATPSAGCGKPASDPPGQFVFNKVVMVSGVARQYSLRLPAGYDSSKPYRTIFSLHGCGSHNDQLINIQNATGFDAIIIAPEQISGNCFDDQSNMSKDLPVFDALVLWAEANLCVDKARIFSIGFSSGSWMTNILGCERANVIRAKANVSGGLTGSITPARDCMGNVAGIFLHDKDDTQNPIADGMHARDVLLQENGCAMTSTPYTDVPANTTGLCVQYDGCKPGYPVVWCQTSGINHDPQQTRSPNLFWEFLSKF